MISAANLILTAGGSFRPSSVSGYAVDYDPATFGLTNGASVTTLPDSSGNAIHASTLVGSGVTYTLSDSDFGGKPSVVFGGAGKFRTAAFGPYSTYTIFMAYSQTIGTGFNYLFDGRTTNQHATYPSGASSNSQGMYAGAEMLYSQSTYPLYPVVRTFVFNGSSSKLLQDGLLQKSGNTGSQAMAGLTVGGYGSNSADNFITGKLARMIIYNGVPSDADQALIVAYLHTRYSLPSPYSRKTLWGPPIGGLGCSAWPGILTLSGGSLLASYSDGTTAEATNDVFLRFGKSTDGGKTWNRQLGSYAESGQMVSPSLGLVQLGSGRILAPMTALVGGGGVPGSGSPTGRVLYSDDGGATWAILHTFTGGIGTYTFVSPHSNPVRKGGSDSDIRLGAYGRTSLTSRTSAFMLQSTDGGSTWSLVGTVFAEDGTDSFSEITIAHLGGNNWRALCRKDPAAGANSLWTATSSDDGATWTSPVEVFSGTKGVAPCLLPLASTNLLVIYGNRNPNNGVVGRISSDGGATWGSEKSLYIAQAATPDGYGSACEVVPGRIAVAMMGDPLSACMTHVQMWDESYFS